mgnify:CR=1 FL=1
MYYKAELKARNNGRKYRIAAVLRRGKHVVRIGVNSNKTHPKYGRSYPDGSSAHCMHAEMDALRFYKPGDTLEVMRFLPGGGFGMARPCRLCIEVMKEKNIKKVRYTDQLGNWSVLDIE